MKKTVLVTAFIFLFITGSFPGNANEPDILSVASFAPMQVKDTTQLSAEEKFAKDMEEWNKALKAYYYHKKEHFETLPKSKKDIIFLGNSITDNCEWAELFGNPHIKNRGIGGDDTEGILERLSDITSGQPAKIFLMIGTNDLAFGKTVDYIIANYRKIITRIRQESPRTKIYIQSVLPTDDAIQTNRKNTDIILINEGLEKLAREFSLPYIDLFSAFKTENNKLNREYSLDGLHLNGKGYLLWKDVIARYVRE